jgi:uncharacterized protein (TIGR00375 family)
MRDYDLPLFADFHFHSRYSRAVSKEMNLQGLAAGAAAKGLGLIGTGDFSHPAWFAELCEKLEPNGDSGLYRLKGAPHSPLYMLTNEVATFYPDPKGARKVHHVIHAPSLEVVAQINDVYSKRSRLAADGRPMFAKTSSAEMVEMTMQVSKEIFIYPAHAWTPWFGALGSKGGYESLQECYGDQIKHIHALETGLSSDPLMNWRVSGLDKFSLLSNSDAHSNHPWRLGRECNAFGLTPKQATYQNVHEAIIERDPEVFLFTVEVNPAYGKYHWDGHRSCSYSCPPATSAKLHNRCPVCKRLLTIGVENRVEELSDRPQGFVTPNSFPFKTLLPLHELLSAVYSCPLASKKVEEEADRLLGGMPSELFVLLYATIDELNSKASSAQVVGAIMLNREGGVQVQPGFDGEYGVPQLPKNLVLGGPKEKKPEKLGGKKAGKQRTLDAF